MRMLIDGAEGNEIVVDKGADKTVNIMLLTDTGGLIPSTAETWTLQIYDTADRRNAAITSATLTTGTAAAGFGTMILTAAITALLSAGGTYYAYGKRVDAGTLIAFSNRPCTIHVG